MIKSALIFVIVLAAGGFALVSCAGGSASKNSQNEVSISDNYRQTKDGAIIIDDRDLTAEPQIVAATVEAPQNEVQRLTGDNSQISAMYDGFGNKVETRIFIDNPLLQRVVVSTFASGERKGVVYAQNGAINDLPEDLLDKSMSGSADELARSVGVFRPRDESDQPFFLRKTLPETATDSLITAYQYPGMTPPVNSILPETATQTAPPAADTANANTPPAAEQKPAAAQPKPAPETNYQAEMNRILLESNKRRTAKTEGTLTENVKRKNP